MPKIIDYVLIVQPTVFDVEIKVRNFINDGWQPFGQLGYKYISETCFSDGSRTTNYEYFQAVVRYESSEKPDLINKNDLLDFLEQYGK